MGWAGEATGVTPSAGLPLPARLGLSLGLGLLLGASAPPREWALVAPSLAAALAWLVDSPELARTTRRAAAIGLVCGLGFGLVTMRWVGPTVARFSGMGEGAAIAVQGVLVVVEALPLALGCAVYAAIGLRSGVVLALVLALGFTITPMFAPWRPIALALPIEPFAAWLSLGGGTLADFVLLAPLGSLVGPSIPLARRLVLGAALFVLAFGIGEARMQTLETPEPGLRRDRVVAMRPDVSVEVARDPAQDRVRLRRLADATRRAGELRPDVIVWPESAHPMVFDRDAHRDRPAPFATGIESTGALLLAGASSERDRCHRWNGVVAIDSDSRIVGWSDKRRRVPFADHLPVVSSVDPGSACLDLQPATRTSPIAGIGALVCYDEVDPSPAREAAREGARYLVGVTNDAWFVGTAQPVLQARVARMRALETGLDLVRVVDVGDLEHVDRSGRVVARLRGRGPGRLVAEVPRRRSVALAVHTAPYVDLAALVALLALGWRGRAHRRGSSSGGGGR